MFKELLLSACITFISLTLILFIPVNMAKNKIGPSPYQNQIDELLSKTSKGLHPSAPEWGKLKLLIVQSNAWFDQKREPKGFINIVSQKSSILSPILIILWFVTFYAFFKGKELRYKMLSFLMAPAIFTLYGGFSFLAFLMIFSGVLASFLLLKSKQKRSIF